MHDGVINAPICHNDGLVNILIERNIKKKVILSKDPLEESEEEILNINRSQTCARMNDLDLLVTIWRRL